MGSTFGPLREAVHYILWVTPPIYEPARRLPDRAEECSPSLPGLLLVFGDTDRLSVNSWSAKRASSGADPTWSGRVRGEQVPIPTCRAIRDGAVITTRTGKISLVETIPEGAATRWPRIRLRNGRNLERPFRSNGLPSLNLAWVGGGGGPPPGPAPRHRGNRTNGGIRRIRSTEC